jgi:penicillin-binding protein 2
MKPIRWLQLPLLFTLLAACSTTTTSGTPQPGFSIFPTSTPPRTAIVGVTHAPDAEAPMRSFLEALKNGDYATMYALLSKDVQAGMTQDDFGKKYDDALNTMSAGSLDYEVATEALSPNTALVGFRITYHTALVGDIKRDMSANFVLENGQWRLKWDPSLILPELADGNLLKMDYQIPARGNIYDRNGLPIVGQSDAYALGITPGQLNGKSEATLVSELSTLCNIPEADIKASYANAGPDWYVPICDASTDEVKGVLNLGIGGLTATPYTSRFYFNQGLAAQTVGYTAYIDKSQVNEYRRKGYNGSERVGQTGIERSMEQYLAGKHGGTLWVVNPAGQLVAKLGESAPQPADSIYLTIDNNLQLNVQKTLAGFKGAAVVLERDTGRVLAIASSPSFDQNIFDAGNYNNSMVTDLLNNPDQPLVNRATQGQLPPGSVFKVVTFSAGLESGLYEAQTQYDCQYDFTELLQYGGQTLHDWTWTHCQNRLAAGKQCDTGDSKPSGLLTLPEGLMRSCNPFFWHIGLDLYNNNRAGDIAAMAQAFGFGAPTGIGVVDENAGNIQVPNNPIDATNQAIGQGTVTVTPLQVARAIAAIGNGGTLYQPQLIEKIQPVDASTISAFKPVANGTLPLRADNLKLLQDAMVSVVNDPRGTAYYRLRGLNIPVAGKTGTAESGNGNSHAWFAGYTMAAQSTNLPDIAVVVVLENQGEGSDWAAPIFRAIVESYYYGSPQSVPWFGPFGNPYTPTPLGGIPTKTPRP